MKKYTAITYKIRKFLTEENLAILIIACFITLPIFKNFSFLLGKDNLILYLSIIVASIAYASFFINYQKSFVTNKNDKLKIKSLIDSLITSSFLLIFIILMTNSGINLGKLNIIIAVLLGYLAMLGIVTFSFSIVKLWWFIMKGIFKK